MTMGPWKTTKKQSTTKYNAYFMGYIEHTQLTLDIVNDTITVIN